MLCWTRFVGPDLWWRGVKKAKERRYYDTKQWGRLPTTRASLCVTHHAVSSICVTHHAVSSIHASRPIGFALVLVPAERSKDQDQGSYRTHCSCQQRSSVGEQEELLPRTSSYVDSSCLVVSSMVWPRVFLNSVFLAFLRFSLFRAASTNDHSVIENSFLDFKNVFGGKLKNSSHNS